MKYLFFTLSLFLFLSKARSQSGGDVYMNYCSSCHGKKGEGIRAPSWLTAPWKHGETKKAVLQTIKKGLPNTEMMAWENLLTEKQLEEVTEFVIALRKKEKAPKR